MYAVITHQYPKMLSNLSKILDKAAAFADGKKFEVDVLLNSRLAPDQFNFIRQVQITCDTAVRSAARLAGKEPPTMEDVEKTLPELKARIDKSIAYIKSLKEQDFQGAESRRITQPRWEGKSLSGREFFDQHSQPNLYFHMTTAYSILRHNGVEVGKKDYLGELPYSQG